MSQIPQFLYDNRIVSIMDDAIEFGAVSFDKIKQDIRSSLAVAIIDVLGTDAYDLLIGSDNFDKTLKYFSAFLKTGKQEDAYDLLTQLRENSLDHYEFHLETLFNEIYDFKMSA
jgi:hypothetical protein